ncbi:hypothetical protein [Paenibacillus xylanexedens]|uniref:hypothetical protein n=1 Tax=Paenibacillus xylanexedens TaxID=528191 RepID=UPI0011A82E88|nr:hypothetical protein [Paenibacillus xylanexedens]
MKRVFATLIGVVVIGVALFLGMKFIGSPFPTVVEQYDVIPGQGEVNYYEGEGKNPKLKIFWWKE